MTFDGRRKHAARLVERRDRSDVTKCVRFLMRAGAARDWTESELRVLVSTRLEREVSQSNIKSSLWWLQQLEEVERTGAKRGGLGHSLNPDETTYRWKGETDATTETR